jgi:beta-D-xylosidase 4
VIRYGFDALITSQDLAGYYMPPFQQCARDSKVGSIMCSYNAINGVPSCANAYLMQDILRDHWNWKQPNNPYVTSDCNAVLDIWTNHEYVKTAAEAAAVSYNAGTDQVCEVFNRTDIEGAYDQGLLSEANIDRALRRQYEALVIAGYFDPKDSNPYRSIGWDQVSTPEAQALARQAATEGIVLKKNDGTLPMSFNDSITVAIIGMWANGTNQMQGGYSGPAPYLHSPIYAAGQLGINYIYADGPTNETETTGNWTKPALAAARKADMIMYFGGIDWSVEAEALDRYQIAWPQSQLSLIKSLAKMGKPMIVAQLGDQLDDTPLLNNDNINAILWAGYPSQDGGPAVFDIITGAVAPAGRLPVTQYPADYVNEVSLLNMNLAPGKNNPGRTYMWYDNAVIPYGYGLHYTTFSANFKHGSISNGGHRNIQQILSSCSEENKDKCVAGDLSISVSNTGKTTSDFVALTFVRSLTAGPKPYPLKQLAAYTRLSAVGGGKTTTASLPVTLETIARRDTKGNLVLYPGKYEMMLDVPTQDTITFTLTGQEATLDEWPQPPANQTYQAALGCQPYGPCAQLGQPIDSTDLPL